MRILATSHRAWLKDRFGGCVRFDAPMAGHTSFRVGGPAEALVIPENRDMLVSLVVGARARGISYTIVGGGTNLLVTDAGVSGMVILTTRCLDYIVTVEEAIGLIQLSVGAGVPMKHLCRYCLAQGLVGMNFAVGIPGTFGGAVAMNAGTGAGCMADVLSSILVLGADGETKALDRDQLTADHRRLSWETAEEPENAAFPEIILGGEVLLSRGDGDRLRAEARQAMQKRARSQPLGAPSAGCVFKNPSVEEPAGRLIQLAGLKGTQIGGARVSERHANYIVNTGGATAADVLALMSLIQTRVSERFQIQLEPEVKIVGD